MTADRWAVLVDGLGPQRLVAVAALVVAGLATAAGAAPLHGRLGRGRDPDPALLARLRRVDLLRTAAALVALTAGVAR